MRPRLKICIGLLAHDGYDRLQGFGVPPPPCISYAKIPNYYGPYAYCSLDKGVAYAQ